AASLPRRGVSGEDSPRTPRLSGRVLRPYRPKARRTPAVRIRFLRSLERPSVPPFAAADEPVADGADGPFGVDRSDPPFAATVADEAVVAGTDDPVAVDRADSPFAATAAAGAVVDGADGPFAVDCTDSPFAATAAEEAVVDGADGPFGSEDRA